MGSPSKKKKSHHKPKFVFIFLAYDNLLEKESSQYFICLNKVRKLVDGFGKKVVSWLVWESLG